MDELRGSGRAWIPGVPSVEDQVERDNYVEKEQLRAIGEGLKALTQKDPLSHPPTDIEVLIQRARVDTNLRLDLMEAKNQDYARADDVLENFRRNAEDLGISIPTAILAMASKHWRALCKWSQDKELETTNFDEIVGDIHNFLDILKHWKEKDNESLNTGMDELASKIREENIVKVDASDDPYRQWKVKPDA